MIWIGGGFGFRQHIVAGFVESEKIIGIGPISHPVRQGELDVTSALETVLSLNGLQQPGGLDVALQGDPLGLGRTLHQCRKLRTDLIRRLSGMLDIFRGRNDNMIWHDGYPSSAAY